MITLLAALLLAPHASWAAASPLGSTWETIRMRAAGQASERGALAAPPKYDYSAMVRLDEQAIRRPGGLETVSRQMFEAYLTSEVSPFFRGVARMVFERALPWNAAFARDRFDNLALYFSKEKVVPGEPAILVCVNRTRYRGKDVEFLRFMRGAGDSTAVRINGALVREPDQTVRLWQASSKRSFDDFSAWFDKTTDGWQ